MKRAPRLITAALAAVAAVSAQADDGDSSSWQWSKPSGSVTNLFQAYTQRIEGLPDIQERIDTSFEFGGSDGTYGLKAVPWAWVMAPEALGGNPNVSRLYLEAREAWAERVSPYIDIRAGNQIFAWGTADQVNPTDVWNPRDYYDPFQSPKLPIAALDIKIHPPQLDHASLELIGTPFFRPSRLPIDIPDSGIESLSLSDSRWLLPLPTTVSAANGTFSAPLQYQVGSPSYPSTWQAGARLRLTSIGGWDFSASYVNQPESLPRFGIETSGNPTSPSLPVVVTLNPIFFRQQMIGLDGAGSISLFGSDIGTRFEAAYFIRDNSRVADAPASEQAGLMRDNYFFGVAGIDYTLQHRIFGTVLYFNLQYAYYERFGTLEQTPGQYVLDGLPDVLPWDRDIILYWEDRIGQDARLKLVGTLVAGLQYGDGMVAPAIQYAWTDDFKTSLGAEVFVGNPSGFFGQFYENNRINFGASYAF